MKKFLAKLFGISAKDLNVDDSWDDDIELFDNDDVQGGIDVRGEVNSKGQIQLKVDWDDEFIATLKTHGYNGANDEVIVQQYIATIHRRMMEEENDGQFS